MREYRKAPVPPWLRPGYNGLLTEPPVGTTRESAMEIIAFYGLRWKNLEIKRGLIKARKDRERSREYRDQQDLAVGWYYFEEQVARIRKSLVCLKEPILSSLHDWYPDEDLYGHDRWYCNNCGIVEDANCEIGNQIGEVVKKKEAMDDSNYGD